MANIHTAASQMYSSGRYLEENPTWHAQDSEWKSRHITHLLKRNNICPMSICDVGCGAGEVLVSLLATFPESHGTGYEMAPQAFAVCKSKSKPPRLTFHNEDVCVSSAKYDLVMAIDVFEHVEDYIGWLRALRAHGNLFAFNIPLELSVQTLLRREFLIERRRKVGHLHHFSKGTALATLRDSGYEVVDSELVSIAIDQPVGWKAKAVRIPRKILHLMDPDFSSRTVGGYSMMVLAK
jgi:cyclopropane fatty-acyl-phospholipid synthase-like methyltransferase